MKRLGTLIVTSLLMVGFSSSVRAATPVAVTNRVNISKDFKFMSDLLTALKQDGVNCSKYSKDQGVLGVREEGTCTFNGQSLTIDLFADSKTAKTMVNAMKAMVIGYIIGLNNWTINVDDEVTAKKLLKGLKVSSY